MPVPDHLRPSWAVPFLAALTAVLLVGCSGPADPPAAPASSSVAVAPSPTELPPADAVKAALKRLAGTTYSYTVAGDYWYPQKYRASGTHDSQARKDSRTYVISGGRKTESRKVIVIGDDSYQKSGADRWLHADLARLNPASVFWAADPDDPGGLDRFAAAIHSTRRLGPNSYEGEAKLEQRAGALTYLPLGAPVLRIKGGGPWVSYTLTTDARGDAVKVKISFETGRPEGMSVTTTFSRLGQPVRITKPSPVIELAPPLYK